MTSPSYKPIQILIISLCLVGVVPSNALQKRTTGYPPEGETPSDTCETKPAQQKKTVRIKISQGTLHQRKVRWVVESNDEAVEDRSGAALPQSNIVVPPNALPYQTAHDIDMSTNTRTALTREGDWARLKIVLGDGMDFIPGYELLVRDKDKSAICDIKGKSKNNRDHYVITATIRYMPAPDNVTPYNIGILLTGVGGVQTPIFVDPKIKNTG